MKWKQVLMFNRSTLQNLTVFCLAASPMGSKPRYQRGWLYTLDRDNFLQINCPLELSPDEFADLKEFIALFMRQLERSVIEAGSVPDAD